jgi:hypothetical protein
MSKEPKKLLRPKAGSVLFLCFFELRVNNNVPTIPKSEPTIHRAYCLLENSAPSIQYAGF